MDPIAVGAFMVVLLGTAWRALVNWRVYRATRLHCCAYSAGYFLTGMTGALVVAAVVFLSSHGSAALGTEAATRAGRLGFIVATPFALVLMGFLVASEWQRLFREYDDWCALVYGPGGRRSRGRARRMLVVHLLGRVPPDVTLSHEVSAAPLVQSLTRGVLPLAALVFAWTTGSSRTFFLSDHLSHDLHYLVTIWWVLITWTSLLALFMLWSALMYSRPRSATGG